MNTTMAGRIGGPHGHRKGPNTQQLIDRLRVPLEAWSVRRRALVALSIAVAVFALGANAWTASDMSGMQASADALSAAQHKLNDAEAALAELPALRRAAPATHVPAGWTSADDVRVVSQLASRHDVSLLKIEPGPVTGSGLDAMRPLHLTAQGDFDHVMDWLGGLASVPVLIVPDELMLKRQGSGLSIGATLRSYASIHPVQAAPRPDVRADPDAFDPDDEIVFYDPFQPETLAGDPAQTESAGSMRLVGLLADRLRGLALIENGDATTTLEPGQQWGSERVAQVDASALRLMRRDGSAHSFTLPEVAE
jgi:Tfp pilus assembly protein PilO